MNNRSPAKRKIRRILLTSLLMPLLTAPLSAQVLIALLFGDKLQSDKLQFGLTVGGNFSTLSGDFDASFDHGLNLGLFFNFKLGERWYLHPAVIPKSPLGARRIAPYALGDATLDSLFADGSIERQLRYVHVPVLIRYELPVGLGFETGPQAALRLRARDFFRRELPDGEELELKRDLRKATNPLDFSWVFGSYYRLGKTNLGVVLDLRYSLGLTPVFKRGDERFPRQTNQFIQFLVGIPIKAAARPKEKDPDGAAD
jgi:hypothetical protein